MAVGAAHLLEQILVGRVVLINEETVWEIEANTAKRIALAWRLVNVDRAVTIALDLEPDSR
jgi:hypothetical protein